MAIISHQIWFWSKPRSGRLRSPVSLAAHDPVLTSCAAVAQFQVSELAGLGIGGETGEPVLINIGEPQPRTGVRAFFADDHSHPLWPAGQV